MGLICLVFSYNNYKTQIGRFPPGLNYGPHMSMSQILYLPGVAGQSSLKHDINFVSTIIQTGELGGEYCLL